MSDTGPVVPCFTPGTYIATTKGEVLVQDLQPGCRVLTRDNGMQEVAWVGRKDLAGTALATHPSLLPVCIKAGALGKGLPHRDMLLSPNHRVLLTSPIAELYFEESEVFAAAKYLIGTAGVTQVHVPQVTYIHFMFTHHEVVWSDGAWTESFHPGDYVIDSVDQEARAEIFALFPELRTDAGLGDYRLARTALRKHETSILLGSDITPPASKSIYHHTKQAPPRLS